MAGAVGEFEAQRGRLFGLAYRLLGSAADAEDVVQDAYLRWHGADPAAIGAPGPWLAKVVTNLAMNRLTSARAQRERYTGPWLPEPVLTADGTLGPLETAQQRELVSLGLLVLLERLTPAERAVFVLREAFGYPHREIAQILDLSEPNCRQLHRRGSQRLGTPLARFRADRGQWRRLTERFLAAAANGDVAGLERLLAEDAGYTGDGQGSGLPVARKPVTGRPRVARFFARVVPRYAADPRFAGVELSVAEVNGQPTVLAWSAETLLAVLLLEADGAAIAALWLVANPGKLAFAARQAAGAPRAEGLPRG